MVALLKKLELLRARNSTRHDEALLQHPETRRVAMPVDTPEWGILGRFFA